MSTQWTAPGSTGSSEESSTASASGPFGTGPVQEEPGANGPFGAPGSPAPTRSPQRELVTSTPLFPLRPLGLGEVLGAAVRIYRLRTRSVLAVAAIVYGIAFVVLTLSTGASMVPMIGDMRASFESPETTTITGMNSVGDVLITVLTTVLSSIVTLLASALVTVALTRIAMGEATGRSVSTAEMWSTMRRRGLAAVGVNLMIGLLSLVAFLVVAGLGSLPLIILQEATALTIIPLVLCIVLALLLMLWIWARTVLAIPALVIEEKGALGAIGRSFSMTRGRRLWRVLGTSLLVYVLYSVAANVVTGVFSTLATIIYVVILLASGGEALILGMAVMTILMMLGSFAATVLLAPFLSAGFVAIYADQRMRHEAWDVELTRLSRESWAADGPR